MSNKAEPAKLHFSFVLETPAAAPEIGRRHFAQKLEFECDVADLIYDLQKGNADFTIIDTRSPKSFALCHIPGAINLPKINAETVADLPRDKTCVVYCWGVACNGSTKGAMKLNELGFRAKELKPISFDGIIMSVVSTAEEGEVNNETLFRFAQNGKFVSAEYTGGKVRIGFLVGTISAAKLCFRYVQVDDSGRLDSGFSICEIKRKSDGRIQLIEHFRWDSREGTGINIFEEIKINSA